MNQKQTVSKNYRRFLLLWSGEFVSSIGGGLTAFGLGVYVFQTTGSAAAMALVSLIAFLPVILLSAPAGVLADKYDRRLLMMVGDGCSALGLVYILICMLSGQAELYQICIGVGISAVFSSLLEPSYRATISDLLTPDEFSRASGMVNIAGSSRYLLSPILAGFLLSVSDIKLLLIIDICTFILTVIATAVVRNGLEAKQSEDTKGFFASLKEGFAAVSAKKGVLYLIIVSSVITCFMGVIQILCEPMILAFQDSKTLGIAETLCASGMLVASVVMGVKKITKNFVPMLWISLFLSGIAMIFMGMRESVIQIVAAGFVFFAMLPPANAALDYLARTNIPDALQGRAWGVIGFISQLGYIVAYALSGILADAVGEYFSIGVGRGAGCVVMVAGGLLALTAFILGRIKEIRELEKP